MRVRRLSISDLAWRSIDITRSAEGRAIEKPSLFKELAISATDLRAGGGTAANSQRDWIEVYGGLGGM